jgi:hypothetical protein
MQKQTPSARHGGGAGASMSASAAARLTGAAAGGGGSGGGGAGSSGGAENPVGALEKALQDAAETLNALALGVVDFRYDGQDAVFSGVNQLVRDLRELESAADGVGADVAVPVDVLEAIDAGRNPELCTLEVLEAAAEASAAARGKLDCMATFWAAMRREMTRAGLEVPTPAEVAAANAAGGDADVAAPAPVPAGERECRGAGRRGPPALYTVLLRLLRVL